MPDPIIPSRRPYIDVGTCQDCCIDAYFSFYQTKASPQIIFRFFSALLVLNTENIQNAIRSYNLGLAHTAFIIINETQLKKIKQSKKLFDAFLKIINDCFIALKKLVLKEETLILHQGFNTFTPPAKLFTQTLVNYKHATTRP